MCIDILEIWFWIANAVFSLGFYLGNNWPNLNFPFGDIRKFLGTCQKIVVSPRIVHVNCLINVSWSVPVPCFMLVSAKPT